MIIQQLIKTAKKYLHKHDQLRYLIAGSFNTAMTFIIYCAFIFLGTEYFIANLIAWIFGTINSFVLNLKFVFKKKYSHKKIISFVATNLFGLLLSMSLLALFIEIFHLNPIVASLLSIPIIVITNYTIFKLLIFKQ